jgi:hypothetical protein
LWAFIDGVTNDSKTLGSIKCGMWGTCRFNDEVESANWQLHSRDEETKQELGKA